MTIVPEVSKKAASIVMLQRSPTYVISRPDKDIIANVLRKVLPDKAAYAITRFKNVAFQQWLYSQSMRTPEKVRDKLIGWVRDALGPDYDVDTHFTPRYNPWEQRLCLIPNGDLFDAINSGKAEVVTDTIDTFTRSGIRLDSGRQLEADIIVTATGLDLVVLGSVDFSVDGKAVDFAETFLYKGIMCSGVPNMLTTFGYMRESERDMPQKPWIEGFSSGYVQRVLHKLPKQGDHEPWINPQNYKKDKKMYRDAQIEDGVLKFSGTSR
jgi:cation diffusion facilitator CzcD-associated flavoprotein CzcO